jgi:hypothetical protein
MEEISLGGAGNQRSDHECFRRIVDGVERTRHGGLDGRCEEHPALPPSDHILQDQLSQMNCGSDIEVDYIKVVVEVGFTHKIAAGADPGIQRNGIYGTPRVLNDFV